MKNKLKIVFILGLVSVVWAVQSEKNNVTKEQQADIEKAIMKVHAEMMGAAENRDAEALYSHVLDGCKGVIVQDGIIMMTRQEALDGTRQGLQGLDSVSYKYNHKHITVVSPTVVVWVADGTTSVKFTGDGGEMSIAFAETIVFTLKDGQWKVFHAHRSVPNPR
ncbi:MAG: nuclear transport factor 2 family protein [Sedimentisphaerales bacterium]|nr:nuclear transport factor 2 family protein [Sedimentisphaerales bacterium]